MSKKLKNIENPEEISETKVRIPLWLYPSTLEALDKSLVLTTCKSRSEFIENAVRFYAGYISGQSAERYLPAALVSALRGTVQDTENRLARLLFKLAVELDMTMNVVAYGMDITRDQLQELRGRCVQEVKKTGGRITFDDAVDYQHGV